MKTLVLSTMLVSSLLVADTQVTVQPIPQQICLAQHKPRCPWRTIITSAVTSALTTTAMFIAVVKFYNE